MISDKLWPLSHRWEGERVCEGCARRCRTSLWEERAMGECTPCMRNMRRSYSSDKTTTDSPETNSQGIPVQSAVQRTAQYFWYHIKQNKWFKGTVVRQFAQHWFNTSFPLIDSYFWGNFFSSEVINSLSEKTTTPSSDWKQVFTRFYCKLKVISTVKNQPWSIAGSSRRPSARRSTTRGLRNLWLKRDEGLGLTAV